MKNEKWFTKKEICEVCKCSHATFERFVAGLNLIGEEQKQIKIRAPRLGGNLYLEPILMRFQVWLMKNQTNQGRGNEVIKQSVTENLEIGVAANAVMSSGNIEAAKQFAQLLIDRTKAVNEVKRLSEENRTLKIELDESTEWTTLQRYFDEKDWKTNRAKLAKISKVLGEHGYQRKKIHSVEYANGLWSYRTKDLNDYFSQPAF